MPNPLYNFRTWLNGKSAKRTSFERQLEGCYRDLYMAAYNYTRRAEDAEDLLQEAVIRAFRSQDRFEEGTNFRAWMWRILTNLYITQYRRRQKQGVDASLDDIDGDLWRGSNPAENTPESVVLAEVLDADLQRALDSLPDSIRIVLVMTELHDMSYQEVADALEIPLGTVRSRLFRGRMMMREHLSRSAVERGWVKND